MAPSISAVRPEDQRPVPVQVLQTRPSISQRDELRQERGHAARPFAAPGAVGATIV
jgi:hypothetical protein